MDTRTYPTRHFAALAAAACLLSAPRVFATDGYFLQGFGAVNAALGGAATAGNDQDLIGSLYKNPADGILFADRTAAIVFGDIRPNVETDSTFGELDMSGSSKSTVSNVPYLSLMGVWKSANPDLAWFVGAVSEAGLSFHAAESTTNPVFFQQPGSAANPYGGLFGGFGDVRSSLYIVRIPIGVSGEISSGWSWGVALAPSIGRNLFSPAAFATPDIGANEHPIYPVVQTQDVEMGMGVQGGLRCQVDRSLALGLSVSSPTWFHTYSWSVTTPTGASRTVDFQMDRPLTAQLGGNYALGELTRVLVDVGYIAYASTAGFDKSGFRPDGSMAGLGWNNAWTFEAGVQQVVAKGVILRAGYNYCSDPIPAAETFYNVASPLSLEHHFSVGASFAVASGTTVDLSYTHALSHDQSGPWYTTTGAIPGTSITSKISGDEFAAGVTFRY